MDITIVNNPIAAILVRGGWITVGSIIVIFLVMLVLALRKARKPVKIRGYYDKNTR